ncbi:ABC transporter permease [Lederbergia sp. NSJ-179]|uniref:ABC transporter permease n=1 Tax=Lederbergia sp. NSJ-179 TaxID=2931402 RepID=UPI001FD3A7E0|nr:ABC transporter permease [Lederbergia sp. NSJ-179]MCJ7843471.1 ABC transporter permease [Lederbergia sp. NSJ-179]
MIRLIQNECMKIFAKISSWFYMIILFVILLGGAAIYLILLKKFPEMGESSASVWTYMNSVVYSVGSLVTLFSVIICSANVAAEFGSGTIKQLLIRPHARWKILLSKYITVTLYALLLMLSLFVMGYLIGLLFFGVGDFNAVTEEIALNGSFTTKIGPLVIKKFLLLLPGLVVVSTISFMLSTLFKSQALAVGVGIFALFISSSIGGVLFFLMEKFAWTKYLIFPHLDLSIYALQDTLAPGVTLGFSSVILLGYYLIFLAITFWFFQKRDISF